MKVLFIHPNPAPYRIGIFNSLATNVDLLCLFLSHNLLNQKFDEKYILTQLHCPYKFLDIGFRITNHYFKYGIFKEILHFKPDIIITSEYNIQTIYVTVLKFFKLIKCNVLTLSDDNIEMIDNMSIEKQCLIKLLWKIGLCGILLCSKDIKDKYIEKFHVQNDKIGLCPVVPGFSEMAQRRLNAQKYIPGLLDRYNLYNKRVLLFVGRLVDVKNVDFLIKVVSQIKRNDFILLIVGSGPLMSNLQYLVKDFNLENKIIFTGRYDGDELFAFYEIADLFILPSKHEPFGSVIAEALACGVPCFVSKYAGAVILISNRNRGQIIDINNPLKVAEEIDSFLTKLHRPLFYRDSLFQDNEFNIIIKEIISYFYKLII